MWIVDDDGDMFNTDYYSNIQLCEYKIMLKNISRPIENREFKIASKSNEERLTRYYDLVEKLTGERIDG